MGQRNYFDYDLSSFQRRELLKMATKICNQVFDLIVEMPEEEFKMLRDGFLNYDESFLEKPHKSTSVFNVLRNEIEGLNKEERKAFMDFFRINADYAYIYGSKAPEF